MSLNFPNSPTLNQTYSYGERTWKWNGTYWETANFTVGYTGSQGYTGSAGAGTSAFSSEYLMTITTNNSNETELLVDGSTRVPVAINKSVNYIINIVARRTDTPDDYAMFELKGIVSNEGGTVSDVGSLYELVIARTNSGYLVDARADNINKTINVYVTGVSGHTINWKAVFQTIEI